VLLHALPIFHTHGLFVATNVTLSAGASMLFLPRFDAAEVMEALPRSTVMMGVPTFYTRLLAQAELDRQRAANIRVFISGSAPLTAETHKAFRERTGHAVLERYGMTETNMITSNPYDGERRAGSVGRPLPGMELRIADPETGRALPTGEAGVIEVRGPSVFIGYWRNPEKTKAEFRDDGYFISGDVGSVSTDGYVSIVGRAKDLVISGGLNVYPSEVETLLDAMPEIAESAVIGVPHGDFGEAVTAVVVGRKGSSADEDTVRARLATSLAKFKVPKRVVFVDQLPRNVMGKIQKNVLRETYRDLYAAPASEAAANG
jgi:malonyl-CoA/methylmalonyl-CoA synthetase